jgi:hypothetical protein
VYYSNPYPFYFSK